MHLCAGVEEKAMHKILNSYIMQLHNNQRVSRESRQLQKPRFCLFQFKALVKGQHLLGTLQWATLAKNIHV